MSTPKHSPIDFQNGFPVTTPPPVQSLPPHHHHHHHKHGRIYHLGIVIKLAVMASMGGFLFGYDTGGAGGAIIFLHRDFPDITTEEKELIISITAIGGGIGSLVVGPLADRFGRKLPIIISDFLFFGGSIWLALAPNVATLIAGRFVLGLGVGATCMIIPVYLAEVSPKMIRGSMVTFNIICVCFGQILAYCIAIGVNPNWRLMFAMGAVPAFIQLISMFFVVESPKYLIKAKRTEEARAIMSMIYDKSKRDGLLEIQAELEQMQEELENEVHGPLSQNVKELCTSFGRILLVGVMLQVFQQFGGINTAMYYGPEMMMKAGFGDRNDEISTIYASLPLPIIDCIGTIIACLIVDSLGRRYTMLRALPGAALGMVGLAIGSGIRSYPQYEVAGKWVSFASLFTYMSFFAVGMNGQPWLVNSEIYPLHLRGIGNAFSTTANWISDYILTMLFLSATSSVTGQVISYVALAAVNIGAFVFIYYLLPETKGKTLQEIILLFVDRKNSVCRRLLDTYSVTLTHVNTWDD